MIRKATEKEIKDWDKHIAKNPDGGHLSQSFVWSEYKDQFNWKPNYMVFENNKINYYFLLLNKKSYFVKSIYLCPRGPGLYDYVGNTNLDSNVFKTFTTEIQQYLKQSDKQAAMLHIDPKWYADQIKPSDFGWKLYGTSGDMNSTVFVDLKLKEDQILSNFKKKTRYSIRTASKAGVKAAAVEPTDENLEKMYELMSVTRDRANFFLNKREVMFDHWRRLLEKKEGGRAGLIFASVEGEVIAGTFVTIFDKHAVYKYGGSIDKHRKLMVPYLLQWESMRWAKKQGALEYDMGGTPPSDKLDKSHHYYGIYIFKQKFNDKIVDYCPAHELPLHENKFARYKKVWRVYNSIYIRIKKKIYF